MALAVDPYAVGGATGWVKVCSAIKPCVVQKGSKKDGSGSAAVEATGLKSGAILLRRSPPHFMFMYDLRNGTREIVVAEAASTDLSQWSLTGKTLIAKRNGTWDAGLIEPGPPPLQLDDGNYLFFYNSATLKNDRQYHVGFVILSKYTTLSSVVNGNPPKKRNKKISSTWTIQSNVLFSSFDVTFQSDARNSRPSEPRRGAATERRARFVVE